MPTHETISSSSSDDEVYYDAVQLPKRETASTNDEWKPSKRIRTREPAPAQGIKRTTAARRGRASRDPTYVDDGDDGDTAASNSDASLARLKRPKKRIKKVNPAKTSTSTNSVPRKQRRRAEDVEVPDSNDDQAAVAGPGPSTQRLRDLKKKTRAKRPKDLPPVSSSFNFTPSGLPNTFDNSTQSEEARLHDLLESVDALRSAGNAYYRAGKYDDALSCYSDALSQYPNTISVPPPLSLLTNRAAAYIALHDYPLALKDMQRALSYPCSDTEGNVKRLSRLLRCYLALGKLDGTEVQEAIKHTKDQLVLLGRLEGTERTVRDGQKSLEELESAVAALSAVNQARERADWAQVVQDLDTLVVITKTKTDSLPQEWIMIRGEALGMLGRVDEATQLVGTYIKQAGNRDPAALWFLAIFSFVKAELPQAVAALDALRLSTHLHSQASRLLHRAYNVSTLFTQAAANANAKRWAKSVASLTEVLRIASEEQPINGGIRVAATLERAEAYLQLSNYSSAMKDCSAVANNTRASASQLFKAHVVLANIQLQTGDAAAAIKSLTQALKHTDGVDGSDMLAVKAELRRLKTSKQDERRWREGASHYEILGIPPTATSAEIRGAYKKESLRNHPDKPGGDAERFKRISEAYTSLSNKPARSGGTRTGSSHSYAYRRY